MHGERAGQRPHRVDERPPQPLAAALGVGRGEHQAVGVVHLGPEVIGAGRVLAVQEHAGQWRNAQRGHAGAQKQPGAHLHPGLAARDERETVSPRGPRGVEQGVERQRLGAGRGPLDPELLEARELLPLPAHGVDGQPAGGQAVALPGPQGAEVAGAQEHGEFVLVHRRVQGVVHAEPGMAQVGPVLRVEPLLPVAVIGRVEPQVLRRAVHQFVDDHRLRLELAQVEEHQLERQCVRAPQRPPGLEADVAVLVVAERREFRRQRERRWLVGTAGLGLGPGGNLVKAEGVGGARQGQRNEAGQTAAQREGRRKQDGQIPWGRIGWPIGHTGRSQRGPCHRGNSQIKSMVYTRH